MTFIAVGPIIIEHTHRDLIDYRLWDCLTKQIAQEQGVSLEAAERIMNKALDFLLYVARRGPTIPSPKERIGWRTFVQYTREYREFCEGHVGWFIDYYPEDLTLKSREELVATEAVSTHEEQGRANQ